MKREKLFKALLATGLALLVLTSGMLIHLQASGVNIITGGLNEKRRNEIKSQGKQEVLTAIQDEYNNGSSTNNMLRNIFDGYIVYQANSKYNFAKINTSLNKSLINSNNIKVDSNSGYISYEDSNYKSVAGVDLSLYQGDVDFSKVKNAGFDYCMLRAGYRTYGGGIVTADSKFETYVSDALKNNLDVGVYFFSSAINTNEAKEEANFVLNAIRPYNIKYPIVIDVEDITTGTSRQASLSSDELTEVVKTFCETISNAGYSVMIYSNLKGFVANLNLEELEKYDKWFANYSQTPYYPYKFTMWQYSSTGKVDGINGDVDLNIYLKEK